MTRTVEEAISYCVDAAEEAYAAAMEAPARDTAERAANAAGAASVAYRACMPGLGTSREIQAHIAATIVGWHKRHIDATTVKQLLYAAQLALAAAKERGRK